MSNIYKFKETGNLYEVISFSAKMKNPITREWLDAVIYQSYNNENETWVREKSEFLERFENVKL